MKVNNINVLVILATFLAVMLSTTAIPFSSFHLAWSVAVTYSTLAQCTFPLCLLIAGYQFLNQPLPSVRKIKSVLLTTFITLLTWLLIYILLRYVAGGVFPTTAINTLSNLLIAQFRWVIPVLLLLLLLTPLFNTFIMTASRQRIRYLMLIWFSLASVYLLFTDIRRELITGNTATGSSTLELTVYLAGFYLAGGAIRRFNLQPRVTLSAMAFCLAWVCTATVTYALSVTMVYPNRSFLFYSSPLLVLLALALFLLLLEYRFTPGKKISQLLHKLARLSIGIFFIHLLMLPLLLWFTAINFNDYAAVYTIPAITLICYIFSAALSWLMTCIPVLNRLI